MATFDRNGRVVLPIRLPAGVYKALKDFAYLVDDDRSVNSVVIAALTAYLADEDQVAQLAAAKSDAAQRGTWWWSRQHSAQTGTARPDRAAHPGDEANPAGSAGPAAWVARSARD
jgi:hypothetical protein